MDGIGRRQFLSKGLMASGAAIGVASFEERHLLARAEGPAALGGTQIPKGKIAGMEVPAARIERATYRLQGGCSTS